MADADTIYRVLTVYDVDTSKGEGGMGRFATVLDHTINLLKEAKNVIGEMVTRFWELDSSAESAQIAMAGLANAAHFPGADDFNRSMEMSSSLMKIMRHDAAALSGTYEQMQSIFQAIIPVAHEAGKSLMSAEGMSGKVMEFGNTFNIPAEFIGREFRQMMEGRASVRNALFKDLSMFMGNMSGQDFNALGSVEKWQKVTDALAHFDPMFKRIGDTGKAQLSTLESYWNQLVRIGSDSTFQGLKHSLKEINEWYTKHQEQIDAIARKLGDDLAHKISSAFDALRSAVGYLISNKDTIIHIAEAIGMMWGANKLTGGGAGGGAAIAGMFSGAKGLGGVATGGILGLSIAHLTGETDKLSVASTTLLGAMSGLPGVIGLVSAALLGLQQYLASWADDEARGEVMRRGDLGDPVSIYKRYEAGGSKLTNAVGSEMAAFLTSHGIANAKDGGLSSHALMSFLMLATKDGAMDVSGARAFRSLALATAAGGFLKKHTAPDAEFGPGTGADASLTHDQKIQQLLYEAGKATTIHNTTIGAINMYNNIYDAEDPARVVQHLASSLRQNIEHPRQSASASQVHR